MECGKAADVDPDGTITRSCAHDGTVVMYLDCTLSSHGSLGEVNPLLEAFRKIGLAIMRRLS
jgi:hypothetical protein